jgi:hypothetical protein
MNSAERIELRDRVMKKVFIVGIFLLFSALTAFGATQKINVPRLKFVGGAFRHLVLAQTAPEFVEKRSGFTVLRKYYIARWGVHRYEYGMVQYQCRASQCEELGETVALKYYKSCTGFKKNGQPSCKNLESARIDVTDPYGNSTQAQDRREWFTCEDYGSPCIDRNELNEYPSRARTDDQDLPTGI